MTRLFVRMYAAIGLAVLIALALSVALGLLLLAPMREGAEANLHDRVVEAFRAGGEMVAVERLGVELGASVEMAVPGSPSPARPGPAPVLVSLGDGRSVWMWPRPPWLVVPVLGVAVAALLLVTIAAALWWWLRTLQRGLAELTAAAGRLGQDDLTARAPLRAGGPTAELASTFNGMADRIASVVQAQEELLVGVSHELRTPLMRMRFAIELIDDPRADDLRHDVEEMDRTIGEVLAWGRVRFGAEVRWEQVDVATLIGEVAEEAGRQRVGVEVSVEVPDGMVVRADSALLARAVRNLASKAVRYGRGRARWVAGRWGVGWFVAVEDDGPGIAEAGRERAVQPFVRLDAARADGGVGLGLALVDRVARVHGGRVEIGESEWGGAWVGV